MSSGEGEYFAPRARAPRSASGYGRNDYKNLKIRDLCRSVDYNFPYVSGSMVRDMIKIGDLRWRQFVPKEIHKIIEESTNNQKGVF